MKATLEIDMPQTCLNCPCVQTNPNRAIGNMDIRCAIFNRKVDNDETSAWDDRAEFCPLKETAKEPEVIEAFPERITIRDYFAAAALSGLALNYWQVGLDVNSCMAKDAYFLADAMMKVRNAKHELLDKE